MQDSYTVQPGDVQPFSNIQEIRRCAMNFRKLMLLFPYVHPAALHGVIVKNYFNWELILQMLFAGQDARAGQFWDEVNEHRELEQALQRHGVRLICCNGFREVLLAPQDDSQPCNMQQSPVIRAGQCQRDEMEELQNTCCHHRQQTNCINIIIDKNPQQPNGERNVPETVCEVETQTNDVIRIIVGQRNEGLAVKNTQKIIEIVRNNSLDSNQPAYMIRNVTNTSESTPLEVQQSVKKTKRTQQQRTGATEADEKKPRSWKKRVQSKDLTNEQSETCSIEVKDNSACSQIPKSKKGKASSNTRVKSSKNTTSNQ